MKRRKSQTRRTGTKDSKKTARTSLPTERVTAADQARAALHAAGALGAEETLAFETRMSADSRLRAEAESFHATAAALARDAAWEEVELRGGPPASLKQRLLDQVRNRAQVWKEWKGPGATAEGLRIVRAAEGRWQPIAVSGVQVKQLSVDTERRYVTMLVRMEPGTSYPCHRHAGLEECYVLEGDLRVGETVLTAGDYQRADAASLHGVQSTSKGCLLLIVSSQNDELIGEG